MKIQIEKTRMFLNHKIMVENDINGDALEKGIISKSKFAELLFPKSSRNSQKVLYSKLVQGNNKGIKIELLDRICLITECDYNYIFTE